MPSINDTILAKSPPQTTAEARSPRALHFALKQTEINIDFHLEQFYRGSRISVHYFSDFESLVTVCQRYPVDAILMGSGAGLTGEIEILRAVKQNVFLSIIPVVLFHPQPLDSDIIAAYQNGAEDFIHGEWREKLIEVRIKRVVERSRRDLSINPSTYLPGPNAIEREMTRQLSLQAEIAVGYADLDNFKAYNDYYGYYQGDAVIRLTSRIIKDVVFDLCRGGFVGHVAGDDFLFIIPSEIIDPVCSGIITTFDSLIPYRYREADQERGYITTISRRGDVEQFPILTISIAVIVNKNGHFSHIGELSKMLADLKKATKLRDGSNYMIERRAKY